MGGERVSTGQVPQANHDDALVSKQRSRSPCASNTNVVVPRQAGGGRTWTCASPLWLRTPSCPAPACCAPQAVATARTSSSQGASARPSTPPVRSLRATSVGQVMRGVGGADAWVGGGRAGKAGAVGLRLERLKLPTFDGDVTPFTRPDQLLVVMCTRCGVGRRAVNAGLLFPHDCGYPIS
jgi:hypothetical protein